MKRLRSPLVAWLLSLLVASCVTTGAGLTAARPRQPLPDGLYQHAVTVWTERGGPQQFRGVLRVGAGRLSLVLLSAFDTTLLRITDDLARDQPRLELYGPELPAHAARIEELYLGLKPALVDLAAGHIEAFGRMGVVKRQGFDAAGIPKLTEVAGDGFRIAVEVSHYEPTQPAG